jgi:hypothetical protein
MDKVIDLTFNIICELPSNPAEFLQFWREKIELIPQEYRQNAKVNSEFGEGYLDFSITYTRPETKDEEAFRLECSESQLRYEREDLATYNRLKEKLGL